MFNSGSGKQPFHQKRSTINEINMGTKLNPIIKKSQPGQNVSMASTTYETNTKFADMTAQSVDQESKKIETPYVDQNTRQSNTQGTNDGGENG